MDNKFKPTSEWLKQAEYDFETAEAMSMAGRYIYSVFMCHLAIEKAIKGIYAKQIKKDPPKTHDLVYISETISLDLSVEHSNFLDTLNDLSIPTRYPDELEKLIKQYSKERSNELLNNTKDLLQCLKEKF